MFTPLKNLIRAVKKEKQNKCPFFGLDFLTGLKKIIIQSIKLYQKFVSPYLEACFGKSCRFYPSCSEYSLLALQKHGLKKGFWLGFKRIFKCHPWGSGGVDLP